MRQPATHTISEPASLHHKKPIRHVNSHPTFHTGSSQLNNEESAVLVVPRAVPGRGGERTLTHATGWRRLLRGSAHRGMLRTAQTPLHHHVPLQRRAAPPTIIIAIHGPLAGEAVLVVELVVDADAHVADGGGTRRAYL